MKLIKDPYILINNGIVYHIDSSFSNILSSVDYNMTKDYLVRQELKV